MKESLLYAGIAISVLFTLLYFVILFFFPEWVGISGKDSEATLEAHKEEVSNDEIS